MNQVFISGSFDDLHLRDFRFLEEAARLGTVHVWLWSDDLSTSLDGKSPRFSLAERLYLVQALRFVSQVTPVYRLTDRNQLPERWLKSKITGKDVQPPGKKIWAVDEPNIHPDKILFSQAKGLEFRVIDEASLRTFPISPNTGWLPAPDRKKVMVTGCYDYLHSGHVHFFEIVSQLGELTVVIGHDANIRLLKGEGHPMFSQDQRRYMVQAIRYVGQTLISSGDGWLDAAPEIEKIHPDLYVVNEDGDRPEKRTYCQERGIEYMVLKREPKEGLPARQSTELRGY